MTNQQSQTTSLTASQFWPKSWRTASVETQSLPSSALSPPKKHGSRKHYQPCSSFSDWKAWKTWLRSTKRFKEEKKTWLRKLLIFRRKCDKWSSRLIGSRKCMQTVRLNLESRRYKLRNFNYNCLRLKKHLLISIKHIRRKTKRS